MTLRARLGQLSTPTRRRVYPRIVLVLAIGWSTLFFAYGWNAAAREGRTYGGDFIAYAAAGRLAVEGHPSRAYDDAATLDAEQKLGRPDGFVPFHYPPPFLALSSSFASMPYHVALLLWLGLSGGLFVLALRLTAGTLLTRDGLIVLPAAIINAGFGQNGFLTAAILGSAVALLDARPGIAGLILGLLVYKPQFVPLALVVVLATGRWRTLATTAVSAISLSSLSAVVLGVGVWRTYVADLPDAYDILAKTGAWTHMTTLFASLRLLGLSQPLAQTASMVLIVATGVFVVRIWRSEVPQATKAASLLLGTLLTTPYAFSYDLTVAALGAVWFAHGADRLGWRKVDRFSVALLAMNPLLFTLVAKTGPFEAGWVPVALLFLVLLQRQTPRAFLRREAPVRLYETSLENCIYGYLPSDKPVTNE